IKSLQASRKLTVIFITHDLGVAAQMADHVLVMQQGHVVESGLTTDIFNRPQHPYTQNLLSAVLTSAKPVPSMVQKTEPEFLQINNLQTWFYTGGGSLMEKLFSKTDGATYIKGVDDVSLTLRQGEILGLVGESGSGKSTLGRSVMQLVDTHGGEILLQGR